MKTLLTYLLNHLLFVGTMFAAAAPIAIGGGGEGAGDGTDNTGAGEHEEDPSTDDQPTDDAPEGTEGTEGTEGEEGAEQTEAQKAAAAAKKLDGRQLPQSVRNMMTELQKTDPKAHGFLKDVLFRDRELVKTFPGGLAEAKKFRDQAATIEKDFPEGLEPVKAELAEYHGLDEAYAASDPKVLDVWQQANPDAFKTLVPLAMNRLGQLDPKTYQQWGANLIVTTLNSAGVGHKLAFVNRLISMGDKEGAAAELKTITDWIGTIDTLAKTPVEAATSKNPQLDAREQRIQQQEDQIWSERTSTPINNFRTTLIRSEAKQYLPKDAKGVLLALDDETAEAIDAEVQRRADKILMADPDFVKKFGAYTQAKDAKGLQAYMKQKLTEVLKSRPGKPGPIEQATRLFFRGTAAPKPTPGQKGGAKPGAGQKPGQAAQPQGWTKISADKAPQPHEIDRHATSFEMGMAKQAVLKSGKRVYWGESVPA